MRAIIILGGDKEAHSYHQTSACRRLLILALNGGHDDAVKYPINKGLDVVSASSHHGNELFNRALYLGKPEILQMLFRSSSPSIKEIALSNNGLSIQLAALGGEAVSELLLGHGVQLQPVTLDIAAHSNLLLRWLTCLP